MKEVQRTELLEHFFDGTNIYYKIGFDPLDAETDIKHHFLRYEENEIHRVTHLQNYCLDQYNRQELTIVQLKEQMHRLHQFETFLKTEIQQMIGQFQDSNFSQKYRLAHFNSYWNRVNYPTASKEKHTMSYLELQLSDMMHLLETLLHPSKNRENIVLTLINLIVFLNNFPTLVERDLQLHPPQTVSFSTLKKQYCSRFIYDSELNESQYNQLKLFFDKGLSIILFTVQTRKDKVRWAHKQFMNDLQVKFSCLTDQSLEFPKER